MPTAPLPHRLAARSRPPPLRSAFRNSQTNKCGVPAGSCLSNQVRSLYFADLARMQQGLEPLYFIGRYGGGLNNTNQARAARARAGRAPPPRRAGRGWCGPGLHCLPA